MRATLHIELRDRLGKVLVAHSARNTVLGTGGRLVAELFTGAGSPITHMGVGTSDEQPDSVAITALQNDDGSGQPGIVGDTAAPLAPEEFAIEIDDARRRVVVRVRATLPDSAAVGTLREASLLSRRETGDVLYNRVVFPPITKGDDHDLSLFWEVEFPFGDLQWLVR